MKKLLWLIILAAFASLGFGLVVDYGYSGGNEAYTEITGGTVVATGTQDDAAFPGLTIPFGFTFNEGTVATVNMSANGWINFNSTLNDYYNPISGGSASLGVVSALGADLQGNIAPSDGEMRYETLGAAPNRYTVFQWKNWTKWGYSTYPTQLWKMQIILYETSNNVKIKYSGFNPTTWTGITEVGLRGATNADFKNRTTTTNWAATTGGGANTATCSLSPTVYPANGQYFLFSPPMAGAPPNPAVVSSPANGATGVLSTATLNWGSGGGAPTGYRLYFGTDGGGTVTPTNIVNNLNMFGATTYTPVPALAYLTTYYWKVIAYNGIGDAVGSAIWSFTTGGPTQVVIMNNGSTTVLNDVTYLFYDSGGPAGQYLNGESYTHTFVPETAGAKVHSVFNSYASEPGYDYMAVYDGLTTSDTFLGSYDGTVAIPEFTATGPSGALTFNFTSDVSVTYAGWDAVINSIVPIVIPFPPGPAALVAPIDGAINQDPFTVNLGWNAPVVSPTAGYVEGYGIVIGTDADIYNTYTYYYEALATNSSPYADQGIVLDYSSRWFWGIIPFNSYGSPDTATLPVFSFFTPAAEDMGGNLLLAGQNIGANDVQLNWTRFPIDGSLNWDSGVNTQAIGAGAAIFDVAAKFPTNILSFYAGQYISTVRYFPFNQTAGTPTIGTYTIEVWSGNDATLAPTTLLYSLPVTPTFNVWNDVVIPGILITGTEALYIGYNCNVTQGFPAGCDAGPNVPGGQLINYSGAWSNLVDLSATLTYNWNIQGMVTATPALGRDLFHLLNIPVPQLTAQKRPRPHFAAVPGVNNAIQERLLMGYKVWRNTTLLTPVPIAGLSYYDAAVPDGEYDYQVEGVYYTGSVWSNIWTTTITSASPLAIPFLETWPTGNFGANYWTPQTTNWSASAGYARFYYNPTVLNYESSLTSYNIDCSGATSVRLRYDIYLSNYDTATLEELEVELYSGGVWNLIQHFDNTGGSIAWTRYVFDVTGLAANEIIKIRFRAHGQDSYNINWWDITNVLVDTIYTPTAPDVTEPFAGTVQWTFDPYVDFYEIYNSTDPYAGWGVYGSTTAGSFTFDPAVLPNNLFWVVKGLIGEMP